MIITKFSIKDLEDLSGVKAHTIRIWEKRYNLFTPKRTGTNIRYYDGEALRKLLNVVLLQSNGYKISKISVLSQNQFNEAIQAIGDSKEISFYILDFIPYIVSYDSVGFETLFENIKGRIGFQKTIEEVFFPLLIKIGFLWQSGSVRSSHEHFTFFKVASFVHRETAGIDIKKNTKETVVLFLPQEEMHEALLLYVNYLLLISGYQTIYLGQAVPIEDIKDIVTQNDVKLLTHFTIYPRENKVEAYLEEVQACLSKGSSFLTILDTRDGVLYDKEKGGYGNIKIVKSLEDLLLGFV